MLSKKRPILFDVLGHRGKAQSQSVRTPEPARTVERPRPQSRRPSSKSRARPTLELGTLLARPKVLWTTLAAVLLVTIGFTIWKIRRPVNDQAPALQSSTMAATPGGSEEPTHGYTVCAWSKDYRNKTERRLASDKVHEIVNFLGYHADPELRDVRGLDRPGKEPETGTFKIYVGSANDRTSLGKLSEKLSLVFYKKERLFPNARIVRVERDASPGSKEASDER